MKLREFIGLEEGDVIEGAVSGDLYVIIDVDEPLERYTCLYQPKNGEEMEFGVKFIFYKYAEDYAAVDRTREDVSDLIGCIAEFSSRINCVVDGI